METIRGKSPKTVAEYYLDIRTFFRFLKISRGMVPQDTDVRSITISDVSIDMLKSVTMTDLYDFMQYLAHSRPKFHKSPNTPYGDSPATRARKISALRALFKYLTTKEHLLDENPVAKLDIPKTQKTLPKFLSLDDSIQLLSAVDGENRERDYCILTLFLNCGLRVSELVALNLDDISNDRMRIKGKGSKERIVYLNDACISALNDYLPCRATPRPEYADALFISKRHLRISVQTVKWLVKHHIMAAGLDTSKYSAHKLRHTAATLMYQNGVDVRTLKDVLGHKSLETTMIYTHLVDENLKNAANLNPLANLTPAGKK